MENKNLEKDDPIVLFKKYRYDIELLHWEKRYVWEFYLKHQKEYGSLSKSFHDWLFDYLFLGIK